MNPEHLFCFQGFHLKAGCSGTRAIGRRSTAPGVFQTHKGRCSTLNCCIFLSLNRFRFKDHAGSTPALTAGRGAGCSRSWCWRSTAPGCRAAVASAEP
ncbi:hypothetical protein FKV68_03715 [Sinorhizobium mexicanum]|uniref:Uncharacterized protein n=1 Tax=Sinorhizobium mexicanum TaxID=375549 RepID=A0A859QDS1_9HYPH|nr:hypothetical protein FKV68_03715 [Sinorhizobium mexicanum]